MRRRMRSPKEHLITAAMLAAFSAVTFAILPALAQETGGLDREMRQAIRNACSADYRQFCGSVRPGDGRIAACFRDNAASLSDPCRAALSSLIEQQPPSPPPG